ncbi:hypothetical protein GCM10009654_30330 [Streptomyces hebeiensis]|uniref:Uncharacterized protein n=1 Tax=Streptomyces hebeiensis TaxID=229486 RepID=A0ABN1UUN4_9ACTN
MKRPEITFVESKKVWEPADQFLSLRNRLHLDVAHRGPGGVDRRPDSAGVCQG